MNPMPLDDGLLDRVRDKLAAESSDTTPEVIAAAIRAEAHGVLGDADLLAALRHLQTELTGAGRLEQLLAEPDIADVLVSGPRQVWVDRGHGLQRTGIVFDQPVLDTLLLSAVVHPQQESHRLEAIAERLGVNVLGRHTAVGDAMVTAEIFLKLIPLLAERGIVTLAQAREAAQKTYYARVNY